MTTAFAPTLGIDHLDATQAIARQQVEQVQRAWRGLDPGGLRASFAAGVAPVLVAAITDGQINAAALATPYVSDVLADEHAPAQLPTVVPSAFAGVTTTGLPLASLADLLFVRLLADIGAGMSTTDALLTGLRRALTYTATEITDAGRTATQTQLIADTRVAGYERVVKLPACDRCIILTGRLYRYSHGFRRHPRCDCTMTPVTREQWREANLDNHPRALFDSMTANEQNSRFGAGNAAAIRAGAEKNAARAEQAEARAKAALTAAVNAEIRAAAHGWATPGERAALPRREGPLHRRGRRDRRQGHRRRRRGRAQGPPAPGGDHRSPRPQPRRGPGRAGRRLDRGPDQRDRAQGRHPRGAAAQDAAAARPEGPALTCARGVRRRSRTGETSCPASPACSTRSTAPTTSASCSGSPRPTRRCCPRSAA
jgi:hypothetical protein